MTIKEAVEIVGEWKDYMVGKDLEAIRTLIDGVKVDEGKIER